MAITIEMPRLSDSMHEGIVLRWIKKIGDFVEVGDHLADIETERPTWNFRHARTEP